jgi:hypothetical protein
VKVGSWVEDIDFRVFPMLNVRRLGGARDRKRPTEFSKPIIELTAYGIEGLPETEILYDKALVALYQAKSTQKLTPGGYIHSIIETMGATQFSSPFQDSWRIQGLIQLGIRPPK